MKHDYHDYGFVIFPIDGGKFHADAKFAIVELESDDECFYLECLTENEAERELFDAVKFAVMEELI